MLVARHTHDPSSIAAVGVAGTGRRPSLYLSWLIYCRHVPGRRWYEYLIRTEFLALQPYKCQDLTLDGVIAPYRLSRGHL